jgi:hypothetical protein
MSDLLNSLFHHSSENIFGGQNYYDENGSLTGHSEDNIFGGEDIYDNNNHKAGHSEENIFDGQNTYDQNNHFVGGTQESLDGYNVFGSNHEFIGHSTVNDHGGLFTDLQGSHLTWQDNIFGGISIDPLSNADRISFPSFL